MVGANNHIYCHAGVDCCFGSSNQQMLPPSQTCDACAPLCHRSATSAPTHFCCLLTRAASAPSIRWVDLWCLVISTSCLAPIYTAAVVVSTHPCMHGSNSTQSSPRLHEVHHAQQSSQACYHGLTYDQSRWKHAGLWPRIHAAQEKAHVLHTPPRLSFDLKASNTTHTHAHTCLSLVCTAVHCCRCFLPKLGMC